MRIYDGISGVTFIADMLGVEWSQLVFWEWNHVVHGEIAAVMRTWVKVPIADYRLVLQKPHG